MQKQYLEDFKTYLSFEKNYSEHTIKGYASDIVSFLIWLNSDCLKVDLNKLREYQHFIQRFNYKKTTILRKIASIRGFYKYLYRERLIEVNPADSLIAPKKGKTLPKFLTDDEMEKILDNVEINTPAGFRNKAILELLWATGMRVSELSGLNFEDLELDNNEIRVFGKGAKERIVLISNRAKKYLEQYIKTARPLVAGVNGIKVLPQFEKRPHFEVLESIKKIKNPIARVGMDFGFEKSYNAIVRMVIDDDEKILYIYWQYYKNQMTDDKTAIEIEEFKHSQELIRADSAEPKTIKYYRQEGFNIVGAKKFPGSRLQNTKKIKRFKKIICSTDCIDVIDELEDLTYAVDKQGEIIEDEFNIDPHTFNQNWAC